VYLSAWLDSKRSLRPSTRQSYEAHIRLYLVPHLGTVPLDELTAEHIDTMYRRIGAGDHGRVLSDATLRRVHATLMSALNTAVRRGLLDRNPAATVELPRRSHTNMSVWTAEQFAAFMDAIVEDPLYPLYLLLGLFGLRRGEGCGLRWADVDLDNGCLNIRQQLVVVHGRPILGEPKSASGHRRVDLDAATVELLRGHHDDQQRRRAELGEACTDTGLVFTGEDGRPLDPTYVSRHFDRLVTRHGLPRIRLHDLRHTSASIGLASGESLLEVSRRLGHSYITVTADIYSHLSPAVAREAAERRSRHVFGR
jgi:integrase